MSEEQPDLLPNLLTILALSGQDFRSDFDKKTVDYIEQCLTILDEQVSQQRSVKLKDRRGTVLNYHLNLETDQKMFTKALQKRELPEVDPVKLFVSRSRDNSLAPSVDQPYLLDEEGYDLEPVSQGLGENWKEKQAAITTAVLVDDEDVYSTVEEDSSDEENEARDYDMRSRESRYSHFSEEFAY